MLMFRLAMIGLIVSSAALGAIITYAELKSEGRLLPRYKHDKRRPNSRPERRYYY